MLPEGFGTPEDHVKYISSMMMDDFAQETLDEANERLREYMSLKDQVEREVESMSTETARLDQLEASTALNVANPSVAEAAESLGVHGDELGKLITPEMHEKIKQIIVERDRKLLSHRAQEHAQTIEAMRNSRQIGRSVSGNQPVQKRQRTSRYPDPASQNLTAVEVNFNQMYDLEEKLQYEVATFIQVRVPFHLNRYFM